MGNTGLLKVRSRNDPFTTTSRGNKMPRTQELALLAFLFVQVSTCEGGRRPPPQKGTSKDSQVQTLSE